MSKQKPIEYKGRSWIAQAAKDDIDMDRYHEYIQNRLYKRYDIKTFTFFYEQHSDNFLQQSV